MRRIMAVLIVFFMITLAIPVRATLLPLDMQIDGIKFRTSLTDSEIMMLFPGRNSVGDIQAGDPFYEIGVAVATELYDASGNKVWDAADPATTQTTLVKWTAEGVVSDYDPTMDKYTLTYLEDPAKADVILQDYNFGTTVFPDDNSGGTYIADLYEAGIVTGSSNMIYDSISSGLFINRSIITQVTAVNSALLTCVNYNINDLVAQEALFQVVTDSYTSGITNTKIDTWLINGNPVTGLVIGARGVNTTTFRTPIPEPQSLMLIGVGLVGAAGFFRRRS